MSALRRIVLLRHGETEGRSSSRFHGRGDVPLSEEGRAQMRAARDALATEWFDCVVASPLSRSWEGARLVAGNTAVRIEPDFREVDFGRWEGLTAREIEDRDPILYRDWQARVPGFEFPDGERRKDFLERVSRGLHRLQGSGARSALLVLHKGPIRAVIDELVGEELPRELPALGQSLSASLTSSGSWVLGRRGSNPPGLDEA